jgi:crotonobetainyl-CoA:carnitine CoA-transferase CaiB-like acyl-CoA transferase
MTNAHKPLAGVKVLELARILAGPWAGQTLADLGADVVKVERPGAGDDTRGWGPPYVEAADGGHLSAGYFHSCNRGKRSVAVDFETPEGQAIVRRLAAQADVLIENFKVGGLKKYGLLVRATISSSRPWAGSWTSPARRRASPRSRAWHSPTSSRASTP